MKRMLTLAMVLGMGVTLHAATVELAASADAMSQGPASYWNSNGNYNSDEDYLYFDELDSTGTGSSCQRSYMGFDLTLSGVEGTINSATLTVFSGNTAKTFRVYRITRDDWTETGVSWMSADKNTSTLWDTPGGDYDDSVYAEYTGPGSDGYVVLDVTALVQDAVDAGQTTASFMWVCPQGGAGIDSRDYDGYKADVRHPSLVIDYTVTPEPMTLSMLGLGGLALLKRRRK